MNAGRASFFAAIVAVIASTASLQTASAGWVTNDLSLGEWGFSGTAAVKNRDYNNPSYGSAFNNQSTPANGLTKRSKTVTVNGTPFTFNYVMEDSNDSWSNSASLGPKRGGQEYDSEFMGIGRFGDQVVIAILTGQRPDNGFDDFAPGDIKITTSEGVFGVEVGGGIGGVSGSTYLNLGAVGSNYLVGSDGHTVGALNSDGSLKVASGTSQNSLIQGTSAENSQYHSAQTAGSIWRNPGWIKDSLSGPGTDVQIDFGTGSFAGNAASYTYTRNSLNNDHAIIEVAIPIHVFLGAEITAVEWSPACGNDILVIKNLRISTTPEPASVAMMGIGGIATCLMGARRRRRKIATEQADSVIGTVPVTTDVQ